MQISWELTRNTIVNSLLQQGNGFMLCFECGVIKAIHKNDKQR